MPYYSFRRRYYKPYSRTYRQYSRRSYSVRGTSTRGWRRSGFPTGSRAAYRRVRGYRTTPWSVIRNTYTVPEKKFVDTANDFLVGGNLILLNGIEQGAGYNERIGRNVMIRSVHCKWNLYGAPYNEGAPSFSAGILFRCIVFLDMQPNGEEPSVTGDLLVSSGAGQYPLANLNLSNSQRFRILFDKRYNVSNAGADDRAGWKFQCFDETFQKMNLKIGYSDSALGTIAAIETGALYFYVISDIIDADNLGRCLFSSRVRYFDN